MAFDFSKFTPDIFKVKPKEESIKDTSNKFDGEHISYERYGFTNAGYMGGSTEGLKICLHRVFTERLADMKRNNNKQEELKKPLRISLQELISTNEGLKNRITELKEETIPSKQKKIDEFKSDIADIRKNPGNYTENHVKVPGFVIGLGILILLTVYLFVFYSSASYSALFKEFTPDETVVAKAIFDGQAISKALRDGVAELILILTIPAVFLGLGYLIHKFQETKNKSKYVKIAALLIVTFIFDVIIAYDITEKIYEINRNGSFVDMPPYSFKLAFTNMSFWLIIFAGFIVYLIWGFVFDFVLDSYSKLDHVKVQIRIKEEQIEALKNEIKDHETQIAELKSNIEKNNIAVSKIKEDIGSTIVQTKEMMEALSQFMVGWYKWIANGREYSRSEHNKIYEDFVAANINTIPSIINAN